MRRPMFASIYAAQKFDKADLVKTPLVKTERLHLGLFCLEPGQGQEVHVHEASDKIYFVIEGVATVAVGSETGQIGPGAFALAEAGKAHGLWNKGRDRLTVLVVAAPPPHAHPKA